MKRIPFATRTGSWLQRHPLVLARWLALGNATQRFTQNGPRKVAAISIFAAGALLLYAAVRLERAEIESLAEILLSHWMIAALVVAVHAASTVTRHRRRSEARHSSSWLMATPIDPASIRLSIVIDRLAPLLLQCAVAIALLTLIVLASGLGFGVVARLVAITTAGALTGVVISEVTARFKTRPSHPASRYVATKTADADRAMQPSATALAHWPVRQASAWSRPENTRMLLLIALLSVPAGLSTLQAVAIVAIWVLMTYLGGLLNAMVHVARQANQWLRSTPIEFSQFAWPIARRVLIHQAIGTVVMVGVLLMLGAKPPVALYVGLLWLMVIAIVMTASLVEIYRGRSPLLKISLAITAMAATESRAHYWSIPLVALFAAWQLRAGTKS